MNIYKMLIMSNDTLPLILTFSLPNILSHVL